MSKQNKATKTVILKKIANQNGVSLAKLTRLIKIQSGVPYLIGKPGTAKTAIIEEIAKREGWRIIVRILGQIDESEVVGTHQVFVDGKGCNLFRFCPPQYLVEANEQPTLIIFDELKRAPEAVRNAALRIFNQRRVGDFQLNENVFMVAMGNFGDEDGTEVIV